MKTGIQTAIVKNFHLPLPDDVYQALRQEAVALRKPATVVAREAIEGWLRERRRIAVREAIAAYASRHAGTVADLDPSLEQASLDLWSEGTRISRSAPGPPGREERGLGGRPEPPMVSEKKRPKR